MSKRARKARRAAQRKKVQKRFKARVAAGKSGLTGGARGDKSKGTTTIGNYREAQRARITSAAAARNKAFQDSRAGLDSQRLGAEATAMTGIPSGDALKPGMLTISPEVKAAQQKETTEKSMFNPNRLLNNSPNINFNYSPGQTPSFGQFYNQTGKGLVQNYFNTSKYINDGLNKRLKHESIRPWGDWKDMFRSPSKVNPKTLIGDDRLQRGVGNIKNLKNPGVLGRPDRSILGVDLGNLFTGKWNKVFVPGSEGGPASAPTPLARQVFKKYGANLLGNISMLPTMKSIFDAGSDTGIKEGINTIGTWNDKVSFLPTSHVGDPTTDIGHNLGKKIFGIEENKNRLSRALGGTLDAVTGNKYDFDNLGGQTEEGKIAAENRKNLYNTTLDSLKIANNLRGTDYLTQKKEQPQFATWRENVNENKAIQPIKAPSLKDIGSEFSNLYGVDNSLSGFLKAASGEGTGDYQNISNVVSNIKDITEAKNKAKAFQNLSTSDKSNLVNAAGNVVDNSKVFQNLGEQYTGSETFKPQTQNLLSAINQTMKESSKDASGRVDPINKLLKSFNDIEGYGTASRFLKSSGDKNLTTRANFINAYDPSSPTLETLSNADRGLVGSVGNLLIGGKMSDIFRANNPYGEEGRGTEFTPTDSANLIANSLVSAGTPGSLTNKRVNEIRRLITPGGEVTPGSLIRGTLPRLPMLGGGGRGGNTSNNYRSSGTTQALRDVATAEQPMEELLPILPQTQLPNLQDIQQQAYNNQMNVFGMNPNYLAQILQPSYNRPRQNFRRLFNRGYF